jgi:N-formylglutamate amidohydrolase
VAEQYFSSATFDRVQFDAEGEPPYAYEFAGTAEDGTAFEIDVLADGMLSEIEEVIEASEVPETANSLFQAYFADLQVELIERSTRPLANGVMGIWYEYDGIGADGRELDVEVNEDGTMMVVEIGG